MKRVFFDMDGVLCEYHEDATMEDMEKDGYFRSLAPRTNMLEAVKCLIASGETEVYILSSVLPQRKEEATAEKNAWLNEHLPAIDEKHRLFPICGTDKAEAAGGVGSCDILFDDYTVNLDLWQAAGGRAVKILNECNGRTGRFTAGPRLRVNRPNEILETVRAM